MMKGVRCSGKNIPFLEPTSLSSCCLALAPYLRRRLPNFEGALAMGPVPPLPELLVNSCRRYRIHLRICGYLVPRASAAPTKASRSDSKSPEISVVAPLLVAAAGCSLSHLITQGATMSGLNSSEAVSTPIHVPSSRTSLANSRIHDGSDFMSENRVSVW